MKRSEIINLIADHFYENGVEPDDADEEACLLLLALEKKGMLPPDIVHPKNKGLKHIDWACKLASANAHGYNSGLHYDYTINEWEPEDET